MSELWVLHRTPRTRGGQNVIVEVPIRVCGRRCRQRQRRRGLGRGRVHGLERRRAGPAGFGKSRQPPPFRSRTSIGRACGWFSSIRQTGVILEDPEVSDYIQEIGHSLSSHAEEGQHQFYYFVVKDPVINAFAMPGGFIAINSGLILATRNENELAGVLAHETAHVTQRHLVRQLIDQSHAGLMSTAAMLAAILVGGHRRARLAGRDGGRHPCDAERRDPAPDQLHARQRVRGGPNRHRHHGERRLRPVGNGKLFRLHGRAADRNRAASTPCNS